MIILATNEFSLPVLMEDEVVHTDRQPFCADMRCPCHEDSDAVQEYLAIPLLDGLLTQAEAKRLYSGQQLC